MPNDWEDDDMFDGEEEETDMGDEPPIPVVTQKTATGMTLPVHTSKQSEKQHNDRNKHQGSKGKRTVRVRPMPPGMMQKWPDVVSCLLTLGSGKQVMFVKGG